MKNFIKLSILLFYFTSCNSPENRLQENKNHSFYADSINVLFTKIDSFVNLDPDTAFQYAERAVHISRHNMDTSMLKTSLKYSSDIMYYSGNHKQALQFDLEILSLFNSKEKDNDYFNALNDVANDYQVLGDFNNELLFRLKYDSISNAHNEYSHSITSKQNIGQFYTREGDLEKAENNLLISLQKAKQYDDIIQIVYANTTLARLYVQTNNLLDAQKHLENVSLLLQNQISVNPELQDLILQTSGDLHLALKDYVKAESYYKKALDYNKTQRCNDCIAEAYIGLSIIKDKNGDQESAIFFLLKALEFAKALGLRMDCHDRLSVLYSENFDFEPAYFHLSSYNSIKDSLFDIEKQKQISKVQIKFETEKKDQENALLRKDNQMQTNIRNSTLGFSILILLLILILFNRFRVKKRANLVLFENNILIEKQKNNLIVKNNKLTELNLFKEGMTGMIVHDLKNPLSTVIGLSEKPEIKQAGNQILSMVMNILDVQKFEDAKVKLVLEDFSASRVINESMKQVKLLFERKSITIHSKTNSNTYLHADVEITTRIFTNILTNAIKYTPNNGVISIQDELIDNSGFVKISISDTGQGIPKDMLASVFDKFSQFHTKKSGGVASTGLGLTFCKLAVEAHNGEIGVESELGKGTTFWFLLPKAKSKKIEIEDSIITEVKTEKQLSDADMAYLAPFIISLKTFTVYEFSDIITILNKIKTNNNEQVQHWKTDIENTVRACNETKYNELLNHE